MKFYLLIPCFLVNTAYGQFEAGSTKSSQTIESDSFVVSTYVYFGTEREKDTIINYKFQDTSNTSYGLKNFQKQTPSNITFYSPAVFWKTVESNYGIDITKVVTSSNNVTVEYNYSPPRTIRVFRGNPPPPPPPGPKAFFKLTIDIKAKVKRYVKAFENTYEDKSTTKTYFLYNLPTFSLSTTQENMGWNYISTIKIFRRNKLYREYILTPKLPSLAHVKSSLNEKSNYLLIEIIDNTY